jgi:hypothetical protein
VQKQEFWSCRIGTAILRSAITGTQSSPLAPGNFLVSQHASSPPKKSYRRACVDGASLILQLQNSCLLNSC